MKKYMLLMVACIISQGLSAQVALDITFYGQTETVVLEEKQQETCVIDDVRIVISNLEEKVDSVSLEFAIDKDGVIGTGELTVEFEKTALIRVGSGENAYSLEISAVKQ